MASYLVNAINVGGFELGEADRVLYIFTAEKGLLKAVAKGARKPGSKMSGRSDVLSVNQLQLSTGRTFEIITQAQTLENFPALRSNLASLSYGLYYAELTNCFGAGLEEESQSFFQLLIESLSLLAHTELDPLILCMEFEFALLDFLGYKPELTYCISCRNVLTEYKLSKFNLDLGGIVCLDCAKKGRRFQVREGSENHEGSAEYNELLRGVHITPLVWKSLVLAAENFYSESAQHVELATNMHMAYEAAQRILQSYIEQRAGKRFKSLDVLSQIQSMQARS
ncbi:MAG: DNA repair protein RecO [Candidatus Obscuribacterales bacterium]|nr:DNA repair protein RecO [Candidatus Obscuribacterales bacterium]